MLRTSSDSRAASADSRSAALSAVNSWCRLTAPAIDDESNASPSEFDAAGDIADVAAAVGISTSAAAADESVEIAAATELVSTGDVPVATAVD